MDERTVDKIIEATHRVRGMAALALAMLAIFLAFAAFGEVKGLQYIGSGISATNTISVSGEGTVFAVPDTAEFSVTVQETATDVQSAQSKATAKGNAITDYLKSQGIADTDIQTTDYSIQPQYEYQNAACPQVATQGGTPVYCPPGKQVLTGYQVSETLSVKVRDTSKAGAILSGVGSKGASQVSGLSFTVADQTLLQSQARDKAIADAKSKAQTLAKSLSVSLVRIVGYSESGATPIYAKSYGVMSAAAAPAAPDIQPGQNKITSDVTITYEIQ